MGNYTSQTKNEWVSSSIKSIQHKFGDGKIKDSEGKFIEWNEISNYLEVLYDYKFNSLDIGCYIKNQNPKIDPTELDYYI